MLNALLKVRLAALSQSFVRRGSAAKSRSPLGKAGIALLAVYIVGCFGFMFFGLWSSICEPFREAGLSWFFFGMVGALSVLLGFIGSVMTTQAQLFSAKDNDLLLSMPIKPSMILASRMLMLLILNYVFELLVSVPAIIVWCILYPVSIGGALIFAVSFILLPFMSLTLSCLFGWLLSLITSRMRNKNIVTTVLSLAFLACYFLVFSRINGYITELVAGGAEIAASVMRAAPPVYWLGSAIASGDIASFALHIACCVIPFALVYALLSASFIKLATTQVGAPRLRYRERSLKVASAERALLNKEFARIGSSAMYMMNAGLGLVFLLAAAVMLIIKKDVVSELLLSLSFAKAQSAAAIAAGICLISSFVVFSAPSVSLEGKSIWLMQTLPVKPYAVLRAKAKAHAYLAIPCGIVASAAADIAFAPGGLAEVGLYLMPIAFNLFIAKLGVAVNLHFPKLDWTSEIVAVKQGISVVVAMFSGMALAALPLIGIALIPGDVVPAGLQLVIWTGLYLAASSLTDRFLRGRGSDIFAFLA